MNRAKEFLREALSMMQYGRYAQAEILVGMAVGEVMELEQMAQSPQASIQPVYFVTTEPGVRMLPAELQPRLTREG